MANLNLREQQAEAVMLLQRTNECYEIVMERNSKREQYEYHKESNTLAWVQEVAKSLADIYRLPFIDFVEKKSEAEKQAVKVV